MKAAEPERLDWTIVVVTILVIGFVLVIIAGQLAARFTPSWEMNTNMASHLDPNSDFLTRRPSGFIEPVDAAILTEPGWIDEFLTPGVQIITETPFPGTTSTAPSVSTVVPSVTSTFALPTSPTNTLVFIPSSTSKPKPTKVSPPSTGTHSAPTIAPSSTSTLSSAITSTPTATQTSSATATQTATATTSPTATFTPTNTSSAPPEIGTTPDGVVYILPTGGSLTLSVNLVANGDGSFDLAYYERPAPGGNGIFLDWMIVEISDGTNWYTVFNWGDEVADTNSNMNFNILPNPQVPEETDQRDVPTASLYNGTGIAIDIDAIVPAGTYTSIRFRAPAGDSDNQTEIDAVEVLP